MSAQDMTPLDKLMLQHLCSGDQYSFGADLYDASNFLGSVWFVGHKKWNDAQLCVTFIALRGLEQMGYLTWTGSSRALGHRGYHGGLWRPTEAGMIAASMQVAA